MGCDIHMYVEHKNSDGTWEPVKGPNPWIRFYENCIQNAYSDEHKESCQKSLEKERQEPYRFNEWIYDGRNYCLFAILANVRNSFNISPIVAPRGVPSDVSAYVQQEVDNWGWGIHSHSYLTLDEIVNYNWDNNFCEREAWVSENTYLEFKHGGSPYPSFGDVDGGHVRKVLNKEMDRIIEDKYPWEKDYSFYTPIRWKETYAQNAREFLDNINAFIEREHIQKENYKNYRIVFWFDN